MSGSRLLKKGETEDRSLIEPKTVPHLNYNPFKSHVGRYPKEIQLFPLELRPVLDDQEKRRSDFYEEMRSRKQEQRRREEEMDRAPPMPERRHRVPRRPRGCDESCPSMDRSSCTQGTDVYRNILGPTPDESILAGLQTVIEICGLSDVCHMDSDSLHDSRLITSSSRQSTFYSQDALSLRKSSSDTSQDDSYASRLRYPPDLQWYPGGRRPTRRAIACGSPCGSPREPRDPFRKRSRERQPPMPTMPRDCSPPCPLAIAPPRLVTGQPYPMVPPPPPPRIIGDIASTSVHCALPKCPVPKYHSSYKFETRREGAPPPAAIHSSDLSQKYHVGQEREVPAKYGTAKKGTVPPAPPYKPPADVHKQEYQLPLRDQSVFSTEGPERSDGPAPTAPDEPIKTSVLGQPWGRKRIVERTVGGYQRQNAYRTQDYPAVQEGHLVSERATTTWFDIAKKEQVPSGTVGQGFESSSPEERVTERTTSSKFDIAAKQIVPHGHYPQEYQMRHETYDATQRTTTKKYKTTRKENVPHLVNSAQQFQQLDRVEYPTTELPTIRYGTAQKDSAPAMVLGQSFGQVSETAQHPLIEIVLNRYAMAHRESVPGLAVGTKFEQAFEALQRPVSFVTDKTADRYEIANKGSAPSVQTAQPVQQSKLAELLSTEQALARYQTVKKENLPPSKVPSEVRQSVKMEYPISEETAMLYETNHKETTIKGVEPVEFHSAQQNFFPTKKDKKENYETVKREYIPKRHTFQERGTSPISDGTQKEFTSQASLAREHPSRQEGVAVLSKKTIEKYQIAKALSKSEMVPFHDKADIPLHQPQEAIIPSQKQTTEKYQVVKNVSQSKIVSRTHEETKRAESVKPKSEGRLYAQRKIVRPPPVTMILTYDMKEKITGYRDSFDENDKIPITQLYEDVLKPDNVVPDSVIVLDYRAEDVKVKAKLSQYESVKRDEPPVKREDPKKPEEAPAVKDAKTGPVRKPERQPSRGDVALRTVLKSPSYYQSVTVMERNSDLDPEEMEASTDTKQRPVVIIRPISQELEERQLEKERPPKDHKTEEIRPAGTDVIVFREAGKELTKARPSRYEMVRRELVPCSSVAQVYEESSEGYMLDLKEHEKTETYALRHKSYSKSLSMVRPVEDVRHTYVPIDREKLYSYQLKQKSNAAAAGGSLDHSYEEAREGYVILEKEREQKFHTTYGAFMSHEQTHPFERERILSPEHYVTPRLLVHTVPRALDQPYEIVDERELMTQTLGEPRKQYLISQRSYTPSIVGSTEFHVTKVSSVEEGKDVGGTHQILQKSHLPPLTTDQSHQVAERHEFGSDKEIRQSYRVSKKGYAIPVHAESRKDYEISKEKMILPKEEKQTKDVDAIKPLSLELPYMITGESSMTAISRQEEAKYQIRQKAYAPAFVKEQPFHSPKYSEVGSQACLEQRMMMRQPSNAAALPKEQTHEIVEAKETGMVERSTQKRYQVLLLQDEGQVEKPVASEGGMRTLEKGAKCRRFIPREKRELGDVTKEDTKKPQDEYAVKELHGGAEPQVQHREGLQGTTSCHAKRVSCKDLNESIQTDSLQSDLKVSGESSCSDKCCGPSRELIRCYKIKSDKEVDGRDGWVCLKYAPDLTAQCFPPVNLPGGLQIPNECYGEECNCPPGQCACSACHCLPEDASDTSTRSADTSSSGCCSSKGSSSKSSTKSKASKKSKKTSCVVCKKEPVKDERDKTGSQKSVVVQDPKNLTSSSLFDGKFICNKDYVFPSGEKKAKDFRTSRMSIPAVQPVIGVCTDGRCGTAGAGANGEKLLQVRYSIVRISTFSDYTTYEILKSSTKKPKKLPGVVEGIFVTKR